MGNGLLQFMDGDDGGSRKRVVSRFDKFHKLKRKKKSKEELRRLESKLLVPESIPKYTGEKANASSELSSKTIKLVFSDTEFVEMFARHFRMSRYLENSCHDLDQLVDYLYTLEEKEAHDEEEKEEGTTDRRNRKGKSKVGERKRRRTS